MKQKTIKTGKVEMLVVDLPTLERTIMINYTSESIQVVSYEKSEKADVLLSYASYNIATKEHIYHNVFPLREGKWLARGKATELTEEDWKGIVLGVYNFNHGMVYRDHQSKEPLYFKTATESGLSLLKANGIFLENSISSTYPVTFDRVTKKEWQEAESKVCRNCQVFIKKK